MVLFTFYGPLPHPFMWESKSGETARSLTQLVSVRRGHFHSRCVFYKPLIHWSGWEGGPAASDLSPGQKPALYLLPYCAWLLPWELSLSPSPFLASSLAQLCITAHCGKPGTRSRHHGHVGTCRWACVSNPHRTRPPTSAPGGLSSINNSLLPIRNICEAVETFLLHLQCGPLLMLHRLKAKQNSTSFEIHLGGGGGGGSNCF